VVVAHNASFDVGVLRATLGHFGIACPEFRVTCTLKLARRLWGHLPNHQLSTLAAHIGHQFRHHHAQDDAVAAGKVYWALQQAALPL
jgi:DNA polymerase-3 subunit epsilon